MKRKLSIRHYVELEIGSVNIISNAMINICPICSQDRFGEILRVEPVPISCQKLSAVINSPQTQAVLDIRYCTKCGHIVNCAFEEEIAKDHYGDDYLYSVTHSPSARRYQTKLAEFLFKQLGASELQEIVEIGCGDGFFLKQMSSLFGIKCTGYEPSSAARMASQFSDIDVVNQYYSAEDCRHSENCLVVFRHVLEHLTEPREMLNSVNAEYIYIEVPNTEFLLRHKMFADFYYDHVGYFTTQSIQALMKMTGYEIICTFPGYEEFICLLSKRAVSASSNVLELPVLPEGKFANEVKQLQDFRSEIFDILKTCKKEGKTISIWGAGSRGVGFITNLKLNSDIIQVVIDSDEHKWRKYIPGTDLVVISPAEFSKRPTDVVVISSLTYLAEIITQIRQLLASSKKRPDFMTLYPLQIQKF